MINFFTVIACLVIILAFLFAWLYIANSSKDELDKRCDWIKQLPSVISTLGVLGTFLGITMGLLGFDTSDLDQSIPLLLDGLKTAFFTSLLGMLGSLILNRVVSKKFQTNSTVDEEYHTGQMIVNALDKHFSSLPTLLRANNDELSSAIASSLKSSSLRQDIEQMKDDIEELKGYVTSISDSLKSLAPVITNSLEEDIPQLRAVAVTATASIASTDNSTEDIGKEIVLLRKKLEDVFTTLEEMSSKFD